MSVGGYFRPPASLVAYMTMMCDHTGTCSGASRYSRELGELRLVLLCDDCGTERQELGRVQYRPDAELEPAGLASGGPALAESPSA